MNRHPAVQSAARVLALAALALRTAVRSRLLVALVLLLLLVLAGLPALVRGDGTPVGQARVLLRYSLGLTSLLLGLATLWAACGSIAREIEEKQICLLAVKPVPRSQIWLGKWLGLLAMNAALLALAGLATAGILFRYSHASDTTPAQRRELRDEVLTSRRLVPAAPERVDEEVRQRLDRLVREGRLAPDAPREQAARPLALQILAERSVVAPGGAREWRFDPPRGGWPAPAPDAQAEGAVALRLRLARAAPMELTPISGVWSLRAAPDAAELFTFRMERAPDGPFRLPLPPAALAAGRPLVVRFVNDGADRSGAVVFSRDPPPHLLIRESAFGPNLARALVVIWCHLALLAALGLTAGALFSFPVAVFASLAALVIALTGHYFTAAADPGGALAAHESHHHEDEASGPARLQWIGESLGRRVDAVVAPILRLDPLEPLSDGVLVTWRFAGKAVLLLAVVIPGMLWLAAGYLLSRRELALPG